MLNCSLHPLTDPESNSNFKVRVLLQGYYETMLVSNEGSRVGENSRIPEGLY